MSAARTRSVTPAQAALYGSFAGLIATILVSVLARATTQLRAHALYKDHQSHRPLGGELAEHPVALTAAIKTV